MTKRIVSPGGVENLGQAFVRGKLNRGKWNSHGQGRGVRDIKGAEAFIAVDRTSTIGNRFIGRAVHLHALFDDYRKSVKMISVINIMVKPTIERVH